MALYKIALKDFPKKNLKEGGVIHKATNKNVTKIML